MHRYSDDMLEARENTLLHVLAVTISHSFCSSTPLWVERLYEMED